LLSACSTTIVMRDFTAGTGDYPAIRGKRVAIVNDRHSVPDEMENSSDSHSYIFHEINAGVTSALVRRLSASAKQVSVVMAENFASSKGNYDMAVFPSVQVKVVNDFWTKGCLVTMGLRVESDHGVLATDSQEFKKSFLGPLEAQSACRSAFSSVLARVTDRTMERAAGK